MSLLWFSDVIRNFLYNQWLSAVAFQTPDNDRLPGGGASYNVSSLSGPGSKKHTYNYRQRLTTMDEFEVDESLVFTTVDGKKFNTY